MDQADTGYQSIGEGFVVRPGGGPGKAAVLDKARLVEQRRKTFPGAQPPLPVNPRDRSRPCIVPAAQPGLGDLT